MNFEPFDLNVEKILKDWAPFHAVIEIIANAIDEKQLTSTNNIDLFKEIDNHWHVRDYGRGIRCIHLTQNENNEKLKNNNLIGKYGIGLKDALATFERHGVIVEIHSKYQTMRIAKMKKHGFDDIKNFTRTSI